MFKQFPVSYFFRQETQTLNMWTMLYCWMLTQGNCRFSSITWTVVQVYLGYVSQFQSVRLSCRIGLAQNRNLFLQGKNWMRQISFVISSFGSHLVVVHRMKYPNVCRNLGLNSPTWGIYGVEVIFSYRSKVTVGSVLLCGSWTGPLWAEDGWRLSLFGHLSSWYW